MKSKMAILAESIRRQGFDKSYVSSTGGVRVVCSQCEAKVINGVACHEHNCPNVRRSHGKDFGRD